MKIRGSVGKLHGDFLNGWAFDEEDVERPLEIEIYLDDKKINSSLANKLRTNIKKNKLHPTGLCGFKIDIKDYLLAKGISYYKVKVKGDNKYLHKSPIIIDNRNFKNRILVIGLNKSGTSILTYRIASGLGTNKIHFEPKGKDGLKFYEHHINYTNKNDVITKSLYHHGNSQALPQVASMYNKKIWIVRDPRDVVISSFFYNWYKGHNLPIEKFNIAYQRTVKKEKNPSSVTFLELIDGLINLSGYMKNRYQGTINQIKQLDKTWHLLKYESFIDGDISKTNDYLGFKIDTSAEVNTNVNRVSRSKSYGNWRLWFNESEIPQLKEIFNPALEQLGYDTEDWALENPKQLDASTGSEYMYKLYHD